MGLCISHHKPIPNTHLFKVQDKQNVSVILIEDISFVFSGKLLTHPQPCNHRSSTKDELFINFASYGTQHLFNHVKKTVMRKHNNQILIYITSIHMK